MPWGDDATRFLSRVLSWPASDQDAGYGTIHFMVPNKNPKGAHSPKTFMNGMPFKTVRDAWNYIAKIYIRDNTRDIYFCTGLQRDTKPSRDGSYQIAHRSAENTLGSRVLFLDIDIKPPPKGYATLGEALAELNKFIEKYGLPKPTALVGSGGGVHCYWISNRFLTPDEWQPLANALQSAATQFGLRADPVTTDICRILRVPETRNWKTDPPIPTKLIILAEHDLDFAEQLAPALARVPKVTIASTPASAPAQPAALMFDPKVFKKRVLPAMYAGIESGAAGIEPEAPPLDTEAVLRGCKFMGKALATGGAHHDQPQWRLAVLASTFLPNGEKVAHAISNRHPGYSVEDTDKMIDRCEDDKVRMNMGYPSCASIEQFGSQECADCPLRGKIRSPLNLGHIKKKPPAADSVALVIHTPTDAQPFDPAYLPDGYVFDAKGVPCFVKMSKEKTADGTEEPVDTLVPMFNDQRIYAPYVQETPVLAFGFEVDGNEGRRRRVLIENGATANTTTALAILRQQGVHNHRLTRNTLGDFLMELARRMEMMRRSIDAKPAGWIADENGKYNKFAYGGTTYKADGTTEPSGFLDAEMRKKFQPKGTSDAWKKMAIFTIEQQRADLQVLLAAAFAGPLMIFTNQKLGVLMFVGNTGGGKSTTAKLCQATWGHPDYAPLTQDPTPASLAHIMGTVANLPVIWDDITAGQPQESLHRTLMQDGKERERLLSKTGHGLLVRQQMSWETMLVCTSNLSFIDFLASKGNADSGAARYRVFEMTGVDRGEQVLTHWDVDNMGLPLRHNHGMVGDAYAKFLAENSDHVAALVQERGREFDKLVNATQKERYWSYCCACVLIGAEIARDLGFAPFDLELMRAFLVKSFTDLRRRVQDDLVEGVDVAIEQLSGFIKDNSNAVLITDGVPMKGRSARPINIYVRPHQIFYKNVSVQFVDREIDPICRIDRRKLHEWLEHRKIPTTLIYGRLKKDSYTVTEKMGLGAGTEHASGRERALELKIEPGSWLEQIMRDMRGQRQRGDELPPPPPKGSPPVTDASNTIVANAEIAKAKDAAA